jgi:acyl carrier protein
MTKEEIKAIIFQVLRQVAPDATPETLSDTANIRAELEMDSFDFLQMMVAINEKTQVDIPEQDYAKVVSIQTLTDYILAKKV